MARKPLIITIEKAPKEPDAAEAHAAQEARLDDRRSDLSRTGGFVPASGDPAARW